MIGLHVVEAPNADSEAFRQKIYYGDYILSLDGIPVTSVDNLIAYMDSRKNSQVEVQLLRDRHILNKKVTAGALGLMLQGKEIERQYNLAQRRITQQIREPYLEQVIVTTAPRVEGRKTETTLEIISSECVFGMDCLKDLFSTITDFAGGRSDSFQDALREAKDTCIKELKREAGRMEADAVIAVNLNYSEISGGGKSMLFCVATGTAVRLSTEI